MRRVGVCVVAASLPLALAGAARADHAWDGREVYRGSTPQRIEIIDSMNKGNSALRTSMSRWESGQDRVDLPVTTGSDGQDTRLECPRPGGLKLRVCNANYDNPNWAAAYWPDFCQVDGHGCLHGGRIKIDTADGSSGEYFRALTCHEVGHALALTHRPDGAQTCMETVVDLGDWSDTAPDGHDFDAIKATHDHSHSSSPTSIVGSLDPHEFLGLGLEVGLGGAHVAVDGRVHYLEVGDTTLVARWHEDARGRPFETIAVVPSARPPRGHGRRPSLRPRGRPGRLRPAVGSASARTSLRGGPAPAGAGSS